MKIKYMLSIAMAFSAMTPAFAQEDSSFSGLNLAVLGGYDSIRLSAGGESASKGDLLYGLSLGYNMDLGSAVGGIEVEVADSNVKEVVSYGNEVVTLGAGVDTYIGLRFGAKVSPDVLVYAKAGYTRTRINGSYFDGVDLYTDGANLNGYRLGGGVEYSFGRFGLRGEYRYSDYDRYRYEGIDTGLSAQRHQVVIGVVGKF